MEEAPGGPPKVALGRCFSVDAALGRVRGRDLLDGVERVPPTRLVLVRYELGRRSAFYSLGAERVGVDGPGAFLELEPRVPRCGARRQGLGESAVEAVLAGLRGARAAVFVGRADFVVSSKCLDPRLAVVVRRGGARAALGAAAQCDTAPRGRPRRRGAAQALQQGAGDHVEAQHLSIFFCPGGPGRRVLQSCTRTHILGC